MDNCEKILAQEEAKNIIREDSIIPFGYTKIDDRAFAGRDKLKSVINVSSMKNQREKGLQSEKA